MFNKEKFQEFKKVFKNCLYCEVSNIPNLKIFDISNGDTFFEKEINYLSKKNKEQFLLELFVLYTNGFLKMIRIPKKNEKCYFWNGKNKLEATKDKKPWISTLQKKESKEDNFYRFLPTDSDFLFHHCEPIEDPYILI